MKREAVQEERQRGGKLQPKLEPNDEMNPTSSVRDLTIDRIMEAEEASESRTGDNDIPYLRVGPNSMVPIEYKVWTHITYFLRSSYFYIDSCFVWA